MILERNVTVTDSNFRDQMVSRDVSEFKSDLGYIGQRYINALLKCYYFYNNALKVCSCTAGRQYLFSLSLCCLACAWASNCENSSITASISGWSCRASASSPVCCLRELSKSTDDRHPASCLD